MDLDAVLGGEKNVNNDADLIDGIDEGSISITHPAYRPPSTRSRIAGSFSGIARNHFASLYNGKDIYSIKFRLSNFLI